MFLSFKMTGELKCLEQVVALVFTEIDSKYAKTPTGIWGWKEIPGVEAEKRYKNTAPKLHLSHWNESNKPDYGFNLFPVPLNQEETVSLVRKWIEAQDHSKLPFDPYADSDHLGFSANSTDESWPTVVTFSPYMIAVSK